MKNPIKLVKIFLLVFTGILLNGTLLKAQEAVTDWNFASTTTSANLERMLTDTTGNIYLMGTFTQSEFTYRGRTVPGMSGNDDQNLFIMKLDPTGDLIWIKSIYGSDPGGTISPVEMALNERGEMAILFTSYSTSEVVIGNLSIGAEIDNTNSFVFKITKTGINAWIHEIKAVSASTTEMNATDLKLDEDGSVLLTGWFIGEFVHIDDRSADGLINDAMLFVSRIHDNGNVIWLNNCSFNANDDNGDIYSTRIASADDEFFCIGGYYSGARRFIIGGDTMNVAFQNTNAFIASYFKDGTPRWSKSYAGDSADFVTNIEISETGDVYALGFYNSSYLWVEDQSFFSGYGYYDIFLTRYTADGTYIKANSYETAYPYASMQEKNAYLGFDGEQNVVLCADFYYDISFDDGTDVTNPGAGQSELLMCKLEPESLNPLWVVQGTSTGNDSFEGVQIDRFGNISFTGTSNTTLTVDGQTVTGNISDGIPYVMRVTTDGSLDYYYWQSNELNQYIQNQFVSTDIYGNIYIAGLFNGNEVAISDHSLNENGNDGIFVGKFGRVRNVEGIVLNQFEEPADDGYVKLYGYTMYQRSPLNDSVRINPDGSFLFEDVPYGYYILSAIPTGGLAELYLPTYYPNAEYWEFAGHVEVLPDVMPVIRTIELKTRTIMEGASRLSGGVSEADSSDIVKSASFHEKAKPRAKATVVMARRKSQKSEEYDIVLYIETDESGNFEFENVEDGEYYVWVDEPGLPTENAYLVEVFGSQYVSSLDYLVEEEVIIGISIPHYVTGIEENLLSQSVKVFPNPASDHIFITMETSSQGILDIYDLKGSHLKHIKLNSNDNSVNVTNLEPGNYIFRILTENELVFRKINVIR